MAIDTGDLTPRVSGSASLGVEQLGRCGFANDIRPFCHVHQVSGILHDPRIGGSGVLRYVGGTGSAFQISVDGGVTFNNLTATPHTLQEAYDGGDEVVIDRNAAGYKGILVRETIPGALAADPDDLVNQQNLDYGIAVSGHAADPLNPHGYSLARLRSNALVLTASGIPLGTDRSNSLFVGFDSNLHSTGSIQAKIVTSGSLLIDSMDPMTVSCDSLMQFLGDVGVTWLSSDGNVSCTALEGDVTFTADADVLGPSEDGIGGDIKLSAFGGSGALEYRFGPHQSWYMKTSHSASSGPFSDGFNPLVPSGQIFQMIEENPGTLQESYEAGNVINIAQSTDGNVELISDTGKTRFTSSDGDYAQTNFSGVFASPSEDKAVGDLFLMAHSDVQGINGVDTVAEAGEGYGLPHFGYNTGSGLVQVRTASGVVSAFTSSSLTLSTTFQGINFLTAGFTVQDDLYTRGNSGRFRVLSAGLYRFTYSAFATKTVGSTPQTMEVKLTLAGNDVIGSFSYAMCFDSSDNSSNTANNSVIIAAEAGQTIRIMARVVASPVGETMIVNTRAANVNIEYLGPYRGNAVFTT